jgi:hypothetical protein
MPTNDSRQTNHRPRILHPKDPAAWQSSGFGRWEERFGPSALFDPNIEVIWRIKGIDPLRCVIGMLGAQFELTSGTVGRQRRPGYPGIPEQNVSAAKSVKKVGRPLVLLVVRDVVCRMRGCVVEKQRTGSRGRRPRTRCGWLKSISRFSTSPIYPCSWSFPRRVTTKL